MAWFTDSASSDVQEFAAGTVLIEAGSSSIASQYFDASDGVFVYGVEGVSGDLYEIDVLNKIENKIFNNPNDYSGWYPNALAFDNVNDRLYFATNRSSLSYYDFSSNTLVSAGTLSHPGSKDVYAGAFGGGYYWYVPNGTSNLYKVALDSDGKIESSSYVEMTNSNLSFGDVVIDYADGMIYGSSTSFYFTYDTDTGIFTNLGSAGKDLQLAWGHDGNLYGHSSGSNNTPNWYSVIPTTGAKTWIFEGENSYYDLASGYKSYWNPGDCAWAKFNVKNVGTKNSYVRVSLSDEWMEYVNGEWVAWVLDTDAFPDCSSGNVVTFNLCEGMGDWVQVGDYFYYTPILEPGDTAELCMEVCLSGPNTCNEYQGKRFVMKGSFDAIQITNNAPAANNWYTP